MGRGGEGWGGRRKGEGHCTSCTLLVVLDTARRSKQHWNNSKPEGFLLSCSHRVDGHMEMDTTTHQKVVVKGRGIPRRVMDLLLCEVVTHVRRLHTWGRGGQ